jgi:hypothetical protein
MTTLTENNRNLEFLVSENNGDFSREAVTLISGQNLKACTVLGRITASGKFTILAPAAADGSQNAAAILLYATDASGGDKITSVILGGPGVAVEVNGNLLVWPVGITTPQRTTAIAALLALGIKIR